MQPPATDEIVMVSGITPIRAKKARYYEDSRFKERVLAPPMPAKRNTPQPDDWSALPVPPRPEPIPGSDAAKADAASSANHEETAEEEAKKDEEVEDPASAQLRRQPELSETAVPEKKDEVPVNEFSAGFEDEGEETAVRGRRIFPRMQEVAKQASLDRGDELGM